MRKNTKQTPEHKQMITKENLEIWIETEEGKKAIESSLKEARELTEKFRKAQQISLESLTRVYNR